VVSVPEWETLWPAPFVGVVAALVSYLVGPSRGDLEVDVALASTTTFHSGVLVAFTLAATSFACRPAI
jgi:hypothetical protein